MWKKWKLPIVACATIALSGAGLATAQVSGPAAAPAKRQSLPGPHHAPQQAAPSEGTVRHQLPNAIEWPALDKIRYNPVELITFGDQLIGAVRDEGDIFYFFEGGQIVQEEVGKLGEVHGNYKYDRHGRFDRIEYTDGMIITAKYGINNEMLSLNSAALAVGFQYRTAAGEALGPVTPRKRALEFHSAIAVLRLKQLPTFLQRPAQENIKDVSDETTPEGTPIITIVGQRETEEEWKPSGVDFIPIGGSGMGGGGGGGQGDDPIAIVRREVLIANCMKNCISHYTYIRSKCETGPTWADQAGCHELNGFVRDNCFVACNTGDYQHKWKNDLPPIDYTPWKKRKIY